MRIGIVNDLPMAVEVLRRIVTAGGHEIAWIASNGAEARDRCLADTPDLVLMDLIMPVMDGVQATAAIMRRSPCAILVVTASVMGNAAKVFDAMGYGALDAVRTPVLGDGGVDGSQALLDKIATIGKLIEPQHEPLHRTKLQGPQAASGLPALVALACSTGGPKALATILASVPRRADAAIAIVQHLDMQFSEGLAEWLNEQSQFQVVLAREGMAVEPGTAFLAATNDHLVLAGDLTLRYVRDPVDTPYRPSVDVFFESLREHWPRPGIAALLTGMGNDGAAGLLALRQAEWHTIAQDQNSSVVYGMPGAAARIGAAAEILPLLEIAPAILRQLDRERIAYAGRS
jgi:two-component system response regulator WspF